MPIDHIPYQPERLSPEATSQSAETFKRHMVQRRSVRYFSDEPVPREVIENIIATAASAPSGANKQPWHFCAISNAELKAKIREAAEIEERAFYEQRATEAWLKDLEPLGTDSNKPFLEDAPWLIVVFREMNNPLPDGTTAKNYYVSESVGIASGFLIAAIHQAGLATLTHTPSPMDFLGNILNRPSHQKAYLLLPVGYPAADATVPNIQRKPLRDVLTWL